MFLLVLGRQPERSEMPKVCLVFTEKILGFLDSIEFTCHHPPRDVIHAQDPCKSGELSKSPAKRWWHCRRRKAPSHSDRNVFLLVSADSCQVDPPRLTRRRVGKTGRERDWNVLLILQAGVEILVRRA